MDGLNFGPVHLFQELPCIGGERLDVASLALSEEGIEGQGRFAGSGDTRDDRHFSSRDAAGDVFEVMRPGVDDFDKFVHRADYNIRSHAVVLRSALDLVKQRSDQILGHPVRIIP